jgi:flavine halogenase
VNGKLTQAEVSKTLDFCLNAFQDVSPEVHEAVLQKVDGIDPNTKEKGKFEVNLTEEEQRVLKSIRARQMLRKEDILHINNFSADAIDGFTPKLKRGSLGLIKAMPIAAGERHYKERAD